VNKTDLINALAEKLDGDKKVAQTAVEGFIDLVQREVHKGSSVSISGFGVFEKRARAARTARNPRTGEAVKVRKTTVPAFRPGKYFKDVISGSIKMPKATGKPTSARAAVAAAKAGPTTTTAAAPRTRATRAAAAAPAAAAPAPKTTRARATKAAAAPVAAAPAPKTTRARATKAAAAPVAAAPAPKTTRARTTKAAAPAAAAPKAPARRAAKAK
jgi:DNA-binding protein HU-beta